MSKLKVATDEQFKAFSDDLAKLFKLVKSKDNHVYLRTVQQLINDNIKLTQRVEELENGEANGAKIKESSNDSGNGFVGVGSAAGDQLSGHNNSEDTAPSVHE